MNKLLLLIVLTALKLSALASGPLAFVPNMGQLPPAQQEVLYYGTTPGAKIAFRKAGFSIVLCDVDAGDPNPIEASKSFEGRVHRVDYDFVAPSAGMRVVADAPYPDHENFYLAHCPTGVTRVPRYAQLRYEDVYPGIDIVFYGNEQSLKYDILLDPTARLQDLRMAVKGADSLSLDASGTLHIATSLGMLHDALPAAWDLEGTEKVQVDARFVLEGNVLSFSVKGHEPGRKLVIDPFNTWATYYGGGGFDYGRGVWSVGTSLYMAGETGSVDFPVSVGASQATLAGGRDAFVAAFNADGTRQWSTYIGGTGTDVAEDVATDPSGNVIIAGHCTTTMPVTAGCYQAVHAGGGFDGFIAQFTSAGALVWCTHLGGEDDDHVMDMAVNASGEIAVGGYSRSSFQISTVGVVQATRTGGFDAMVMKFSNAGARLWGTYYGGTSTEYGRGIDFDGLGNIIIVGETYSTNYPTGALAGNTVFQAANAGGVQDMFATKLNPNGNSRIWSTYIGGATGTDRAFTVSTDAANNVYVAGNSWGGFPVTVGVVQTVYAGGSGDGAVIKLGPSGVRLWASYLGGSNYDHIMSIDAVGTTDVILGGETQSAWAAVNNCSVLCSGSSNFCGFVVHLNASGSTRLMSSILGGTSNFNSVLDVNADANSNIFVTGYTNAANYPVGGANVFQNTNGGGSSDAFLGTYNANSCWLIVLDNAELALSASWEGQAALLQWRIPEHTTTTRCALERSWDGTDFHLVHAWEDPAHPSPQSGSYRDASPALPSHAQVWYRLRQTLPSGEQHVSEHVFLSDMGQAAGPRLYPNPAEGSVRVTGLPAEGAFPYTLREIAGKEVRKGLLPGNTAEIPTGDLPRGCYLLQLTVAGKVSTQKLVLQ